jgi:hypothetical protein
MLARRFLQAGVKTHGRKPGTGAFEIYPAKDLLLRIGIDDGWGESLGEREERDRQEENDCGESHK